ncbi:hypothetical protein [Herbaspirillum huttiense]|uniref:Uncharacterized protein n=1 Tax=Herbaspirillum huttiense subsp. lycopersici TaxID=3074428 RepID=A0ABU2EGJ2_9BURK|nr:hypothetical protein [Herbaspirillum huttiense]MDR9846987.1 hypothetical protein [Herbaspirillum huttiense SE1]
MNIKPVESQENHPPSVSGSPYNAFYLPGCKSVERSPAYSSCLFKLEEFDAGRPVAYAGECNIAIRGRQCPAVDMRDQERLAGKALFFMPSATYKNKLVTNLTPPELLPTRQPGQPIKRPFVSDDPRAANYHGRYTEYVPKVAAASAAQPAVSMPAGAMDSPYAAAINAAMSEMTQAQAPAATVTLPKPAPAPTPVAVPKAVEAKPVALAMMPGETPMQYARRVAAARAQQ